MKQEKQPGSLREKLVGMTLICWVLPIMIIVTLAALLLNANYERNLRSQLETDAVYALQRVERCRQSYGDSPRESKRERRRFAQNAEPSA